MLNQTGYQAYRKNKYETASPHRLIQMLYEGAIQNLNAALAALDKSDLSQAHQRIMRAQDIVSELLSSLNEQQGGTIASNLKSLYLYMLNRLVQANVKKQKEPLAEVADLLRELKSAWDQIGREVSVGHG
ncbi:MULTISPECIES: flagellar export chaperone FliS [Cohnella]|uniref:flagellar export chaperone FliS n=1 Tax=Cohnella TaxID=329857 RepID=UPI000E3878B3|nr:flagellar export chaperone FliS [Cohnella sp.]REK66465.1 MAG: flagellar export chaperone FliS [Cohnella sp.]